MLLVVTWLHGAGGSHSNLRCDSLFQEKCVHEISYFIIKYLGDILNNELQGYMFEAVVSVLWSIVIHKNADHLFIMFF